MNIALDHRTKVIIGLVVMVLMVVGGWFVAISPQLDARSVALAQTATVNTANALAQTKLQTLASEAEKLPALEDQLAVLSQSVPSSADSSALLTQINAIAAGAGVIVDGVALDAATAYAPPAAPAAPAADAADATAPVTVPDPTTVAFSDPRITAANFIVVPVSINVTGSNEGVLAFLAGVQSGPRLFLVNSYSSTRNANSGESSSAITADSSVSATVAGFVYVLVDDSTVTAAPAATPAG